MHTLLRVTGVLSGVESSVVLGLGFGGWASVKAVHEPAFVVPLTHAEVMFSRSVRVWIGPARNGEPSRIHSVYSPDKFVNSGVGSPSVLHPGGRASGC